MQGTTHPPDNVQCAYASHHDLYFSPPPEADQKPPADDPYLYTERSQSPLSIDAPTQPRRYLTPSVTSRKGIPAHIYKQLNRCPALSNAIARSSEDEHDQLTEEGSALDPELVQQIMDKRRRNTLSARRSRQKRIKQLQDLEQERNELLKLVHEYRNYILQVQESLKANGIICDLPPFCTQ
ncbi:hypothetical protein JOM56_006946 [Amanita muscaria]